MATTCPSSALCAGVTDITLQSSTRPRHGIPHTTLLMQRQRYSVPRGLREQHAGGDPASTDVGYLSELREEGRRGAGDVTIRRESRRPLTAVEGAEAVVLLR